MSNSDLSIQDGRKSRITIFTTFLTLLFYGGICVAQLKVSFESDTISVFRSREVEVGPHFKLNVDGFEPGKSPVSVRISVLSSSAPKLYTFTAPVITVSADGTVDIKRAFILIQPGENSKEYETIDLQLAYEDGGNTLVKTTVLRVQMEENMTDQNFFNQLTFLTAYNFDFFGKLNSNYVGVFNVYLTGRDRIRKNRSEGRNHWGLNAGMMKINYGLGDHDITSRNLFQNVKISPLDSASPGGRYLRQYNKHSTSTTNSSWSWYAEPLLLLNPDTYEKAGAKIFLHGHLGFFKSTLRRNTKIENLAADTGIIPTTGLSLIPMIEHETTSDSIFSGGYFGLGFTFDIRVNKGKSNLFLQSTAGYTTNHPSPASVPGWNGSGNSRYFYLVKANFSHNLGASSQVIVGQDIRGFWPSYNPLSATYIGLNLKVEKIFDLLK